MTRLKLRTYVRPAIRGFTHLFPAFSARLFASHIIKPDTRSRLRAAEALACTPGVLHYDITVSGDPIAVYQWGDTEKQPYVLFSHGWSSYGLRFAPWIPRLRKLGYAVVAFDHRAHGLSGGHLTSPFDFADTLQAVGSRFGRAAAFIGHSMGASAIVFAMGKAWHPERCILIAPMLSFEANLRCHFNEIGLSARMLGPVDDIIHKLIQKRYADFDAEFRIPHIRCPALIIHDRMDRMTPWDHGVLYATKWSGARLFSTNGLGHNRMVDHPQVIDAALTFLTATSPRPANA